MIKRFLCYWVGHVWCMKDPKALDHPWDVGGAVCEKCGQTTQFPQGPVWNGEDY